MSFRPISRQMRQLERSFVWRRSCFRACLESYCGLSRQSHRALYARFADEFGFDRDDVADADERILRALDALDAERNQMLELLRAFDMKRVRMKARGRRTLSNAERENDATTPIVNPDFDPAHYDAIDIGVSHMHDVPAE